MQKAKVVSPKGVFTKGTTLNKFTGKTIWLGPIVERMLRKIALTLCGGLLLGSLISFPATVSYAPVNETTIETVKPQGNQTLKTAEMPKSDEYYSNLKTLLEVKAEKVPEPEKKPEPVVEEEPASTEESFQFSLPADAPAPEPGTAQAFAKKLLTEQGLDESEYTCLYNLWNRESGWNYQAMNPSSGAYGIPQSLPGDKMASIADDWRTNPETQIRWGLKYISDRYGKPCGAWAHSESVNWY